MPMPWRVGSPAENRFTSCPSAGQRQATELRTGAGAGAGVAGGGGGRVPVVELGREGVEAVRDGVEPLPDGYSRRR